MSDKELERIEVLTQRSEGTITQIAASKNLHLSTRQIRRLESRMQTLGPSGLAHRSRGRRSNRALDPGMLEKVADLVREKYSKLSVSHAHEKVVAEGWVISKERLRILMNEYGFRVAITKEEKTLRTCRTRRSCEGELIQYDGSNHAWFSEWGDEERYNLLGGIDDATGKVWIQFEPDEGIGSTARFWIAFMRHYGKPVSIYLDNYSTYKVNTAAHTDDPDHMTQFERAMGSLRIDIIHAHSPQAKGRIERLWKTLQQRLPHELKLARIRTPLQANEWLKDVFVPQFNARFAVVPSDRSVVYRKLLPEEDISLHRILAGKVSRQIKADYTIQKDGQWYQLLGTPHALLRPRDKVTLEYWPDGSMHIADREVLLNFVALPEKPGKVWEVKKKRDRIYTIPKADHPWKKGFMKKELAPV